MACCCGISTCCCPGNKIPGVILMTLRQSLFQEFQSDIRFLMRWVSFADYPGGCLPELVNGSGQCVTPCTPQSIGGLWRALDIQVGNRRIDFFLACCPGPPCYFSLMTHRGCDDTPGLCPPNCGNEQFTIGTSPFTDCVTCSCCDPLCIGPVANTAIPGVFGCTGYNLAGFKITLPQ